MTDMEFIILGKQVSYYRNKFKMSIENLSQKSGIRINYLKKIESGKAIRINLSHLEKICYAFNIEICELLNFNNKF